MYLSGVVRYPAGPIYQQLHISDLVCAICDMDSDRLGSALR